MAPASWAHPRGRGEHASTGGGVLTAAGSSPRTRGTRSVSPWSRFFGGLIPADAGTPFGALLVAVFRGAHPRGRGDHASTVGGVLTAAGSSPRTRGTRSVTNWSRFFAGLIPADAGNTDFWMVDSNGTGAHPRGRGEHSRYNRRWPFSPGSSPRTRGTRKCEPSGILIFGLIPADAGNTPVLG